MNQEARDLKRHIKKINRKIKYLEKELENKKEYIKELEDIEDNRLILCLRNIKNDEIVIRTTRPTIAGPILIFLSFLIRFSFAAPILHHLCLL